MGIMVSSLLWSKADLYHQQYQGCLGDPGTCRRSRLIGFRTLMWLLSLPSLSFRILALGFRVRLTSREEKLEADGPKTFWD